MRAEEACGILLSPTAHAPTPSRGRGVWYRTTFSLDASRRYNVNVGDETFVVEVGAGDDEGQVARAEGPAMGLGAEDVVALEAWLREQVADDAEFQVIRRIDAEASLSQQ